MSRLTSDSREAIDPPQLDDSLDSDDDADFVSRSSTAASPQPTNYSHNTAPSPLPSGHHYHVPTAEVPPTMHIPPSTGLVETPTNPQPPPMRSFAEERMRRKLQFFFMNPIEKWQTRRRFPYKFVVQVIKLVIVSMQLCLFAHSRYNHVNYTWDNRVSFSHLFLRNWDATLEVESYPPSIGPLALYKQNDFFDTIDYAAQGYGSVNDSIGPYSYPTDDNSIAPLKLCLYQYKQGTIFGFNESYVFNPDIERVCLTMQTTNVTAVGSKAYLAAKEVVVNFESLVTATLEFSLKTVNFKVIFGCVELFVGFFVFFSGRFMAFIGRLIVCFSRI